jgi:hypothetical protein
VIPGLAVAISPPLADLSGHAMLDRIAGREDLAIEMEARAERERELELIERHLAAGESIRSPR